MIAPPRQAESEPATCLLQAYLTVLGLHLGGGLFEALVVIPRWAATPTPEEVGDSLRQSGHARAGRVFWPYTGGCVLALTAASLPVAARCSGDRRRWWLTSSGVIAVESVATLAYFVPTITQLIERAEQLPRDQVRTMASRWVVLDRVRLGIGILAWIAGLVGLSRR